VLELKSLFIMATLAFTWISCVPGTGPIIKDCVLPEDQSSTLNGKWPVLPVPIALRAGDWNDTESQAFSKAISTWNKFHLATRGVALFEILPPVNQVPSSALCSITNATDSGFSSPIPVFKIVAGWPSAQSDAIGITKFCFLPEGNGGLPNLYNGAMDINYQFFFGAGLKKPNLQSIFLHELGHLIGLNHTCTSGSFTNGFPDCADPNLDFEYVIASLFPIVNFPDGVNGESKQSLQKNDQGRANCLYEGLAGVEDSDP
jgi:hypothetical protein